MTPQPGTTINRSLTADYTPYVLNPTTGQPFEVFARTLQNQPTLNLDTYDPERKNSYESFNFEGRWRIPGGGQVFGGVAFERERFKNCTSPDDPNYTVGGNANGQALCDEYQLEIPFRPSWKASATKEVGWGVNVSMSFQNNSSPVSSRTMAVTRGSTRYPANCPAPCPAGQIIMPATVFGQTSMTYNLEPVRATSVERIVQLDFKVSRRFQAGRFSVLPTFEVFNINNSDAIISYVSTSVLSASGYLAPNSIMQGRMYGLGVVTRW